MKKGKENTNNSMKSPSTRKIFKKKSLPPSLSS